MSLKRFVSCSAGYGICRAAEWAGMEAAGVFFLLAGEWRDRYTTLVSVLRDAGGFRAIMCAGGGGGLGFDLQK